MEKPTSSPSDPLLSHQPPPPPPYYASPAPPYQDPYDHPSAYVLLPAYPRRRRRRPSCHCCSSLLSSSSLLTLLFSLLLLFSALFFLWPSDPEIKLVRLRLDRIRVSTTPLASLDVSMDLKIKVRNRDFFSLDYNSIVVSIGYRGRRLGSVSSDGGHVRARGVSYVDAELRLDGIQVLHDVFYLIEDLARGSIPFETITEVEGKLHVLAFDIPIQGRISCAVNVNPQNQTVVRQDCYPE